MNRSPAESTAKTWLTSSSSLHPWQRPWPRLCCLSPDQFPCSSLACCPRSNQGRLFKIKICSRHLSVKSPPTTLRMKFKQGLLAQPGLSLSLLSFCSLTCSNLKTHQGFCICCFSTWEVPGQLFTWLVLPSPKFQLGCSPERCLLSPPKLSLSPHSLVHYPLPCFSFF